jgi:hypothetical protein
MLDRRQALSILAGGIVMPRGDASGSNIRERPVVLEGDPAPLHGTLALPDTPGASSRPS